MEQNFDRHFFLYAKGHYIRINATVDLKKLVALRCGLDEKHVSDIDVISILSLVQCNKVSLDKFLTKLIDIERYYPEYTYHEKLIHALLYFLQFADVKDIPFKLGEADSTILPLRTDN